MISLEKSVKILSGVGEERAKKLAKLGITTVRDLLFHFPRAYQIRGNVTFAKNAEIGKEVSLILTVRGEVTASRTKNDISLYSFNAFDETDSLRIIFFRSPFVKQVFQSGLSFRFYGKVQWYGRNLAMISPQYEAYIPGIPLPYYYPIYPLSAGLTSKTISSILENSMSEWQHQIYDPLPESIRMEYQLPTLGFAIQNLHFPENKDSLSLAAKRMAFDELFEFALIVSATANMQKRSKGAKISPINIKEITSLFPFSLTNGQLTAVKEILDDMTNLNSGVMSRILIGDVGSGKTAVAMIAAFAAIKSKKQVVLMAPTEILATQHYNSFIKIFEALHIKTALLLGNTKKSEKTKIANDLKEGKLDLLIGTHAVLNDSLAFSDLGLIITDEQHRFGIKQRAFLKQKNEMAHVLVMSATPIPRSLSLALYGDLNISTIREMPIGRQKVDTYIVDESYRQRLNSFIEKQITLGGQCYIVCPGIEESEDLEYTAEDLFDINDSASLTNRKTVLSYTEILKKQFPTITVESLHGKMSSKEKDQIMTDFMNGKIQILVSTTVIEVGVNNPNATLMVIENAERFGLSQLHQLRGRVGRSDKKSYCILVSDSQNESAKERLSIIKNNYDGFAIAEKDLMMRGPGDFFSVNSDEIVKQSGSFHFRFASLQKDEKFMEQIFATAKKIMQTDPNLSEPSHLSLQPYILPYIKNNLSTIS